MGRRVRHVLDTRELRKELREWKALLLADIKRQVNEDIEVLLDATEERIASKAIGEVRE